jgi:dUTP pyrophosphatase
MINTINIKVKQINENAILPKYSTEGAACFDLYATSSTIVNSHEGSTFIGTGLTFEIPVGFVMLVYSRSGHGFKNDIRLCNSVGVIDSDYRGEVMVKLHNDGINPYTVSQGERIAQAMIVPYFQANLVVSDELSDTSRGIGGFGSTGK